MTIEMADRSMQSPKGIKENVLVKISNFVFPVDFIILDIMEDENVPIILGRPMLAIALAKIDVYGKKISMELEMTNQNIISLSPSESAEIKEYFSMTPSDPDKRMSIGLEDFVDIDDMWDDLDPGILTNEKAKTEFLKSGINMAGLAKNLHMFIGNHQFLVDFIILENISEFVEKGLTEVLFGCSFKEQIGLVKDRGKGILWFKIVMKIREEESISLKKIKGFYRGCLSLGNEYKYDQEVVDWIRGCINDEMT
ncbi:homeodomain-like protein [Tanacetum coccineum]